MCGRHSSVKSLLAKETSYIFKFSWLLLIAPSGEIHKCFQGEVQIETFTKIKGHERDMLEESKSTGKACSVQESKEFPGYKPPVTAKSPFL